MTERQRLDVCVNDELTLDAGTVEHVDGPDGAELLLRPPEETLYHQVVAYLSSKPDPTGRRVGSRIGREGLAATALVLRWGSYLAVLLDRGKLLWSEAGTEGVSRISDSEMARINIEASAALAEWIDLLREDAPGYERLVARAVAYLPMPRPTRTATNVPFAALAHPEMARRLVAAFDPGRLESVRADAERHATRLLANAVVNVAWRNGPIEEVYAGAFRGYPLDRRRIAPAEEADLMRHVAAGMALGVSVCHELVFERPRRPWTEQVLPYGLAEMMLITPTGWSLTEATRAVRLLDDAVFG